MCERCNDKKTVSVTRGAHRQSIACPKCQKVEYDTLVRIEPSQYGKRCPECGSPVFLTPDGNQITVV